MRYDALKSKTTNIVESEERKYGPEEQEVGNMGALQYHYVH